MAIPVSHIKLFQHSEEDENSLISILWAAQDSLCWANMFIHMLTTELSHPGQRAVCVLIGLEWSHSLLEELRVESSFLGHQ